MIFSAFHTYTQHTKHIYLYLDKKKQTHHKTHTIRPYNHSTEKALYNIKLAILFVGIVMWLFFFDNKWWGLPDTKGM